MLKKTIDTIEEKIQHVDSMKDDTKTELLNLLSTLKEEIGDSLKPRVKKRKVSPDLRQISTHEAIRQEKNPDLLNLSLKGYNHQ